MKTPTESTSHLIITNGQGRLFIQTLLPPDPQVRLVTGSDLYSYGGKTYPPERDTGPAPECRIEISPSEPASVDYFLHVLTATDANAASVEQATAEVKGHEVSVTIGKTAITFTTTEVGGHIEISGRHVEFADRIVQEVFP
jgi:hypothetical protein